MWFKIWMQKNETKENTTGMENRIKSIQSSVALDERMYWKLLLTLIKTRSFMYTNIYTHKY